MALKRFGQSARRYLVKLAVGQLRDCDLALINHLRGLPVEPVDEFLIAPTEDFLQEILHGLVLCSLVLCGRDLCPCI